jgi:hypothetical protein
MANDKTMDTTELDALKKEVATLKAQMYENYLLHPKAIASLLNNSDSGKLAPYTDEAVETWINAHAPEAQYCPATEADRWKEHVDAAKLFTDMFNQLTEARVSFNKIHHDPKLTEWIIENDPNHLAELANFLKALLSTSIAERQS